MLFDLSPLSSLSLAAQLLTGRARHIRSFRPALVFLMLGLALLCCTRQSQAQATLLKDPDGGISPYEFTIVDGKLFFAAYGAGTGTELWVSDGTGGGTKVVKDINPGGSSSPVELTPFNGQVFFTADDGTGAELWKSDGTEVGTQKVKDIWSHEDGAWPYDLTVLGSELFFTANDGTHGIELWKTDGTEAGTVLAKDINVGAGASSPAALIVFDNRLFFAAMGELWVSDGTTDGTTLFKDLAMVGGSSPNYFTISNGKLFFTARDIMSTGTELWVSDGTTDGTMLVKDINPGTSNAFLTQPRFATLGTELFFSAMSETGIELWKSDGTEAGTMLVKDINPSSDGMALNYSMYPFNGQLFFAANDGTNGVELWVTDGTEAGTVMFKEINPAPGTANEAYPPAEFFSTGGYLLFQANDGTNGNELWVTDGTEAGTRLLQNIKPGGGHSNPQRFISFAGNIVFRAEDDFNLHGEQVWVLSPTLLPVELTAFEARLDGASVHLMWETASETNNAGFEVQHAPLAPAGAAAEPDWQPVTYLEGHGTTSERQRYAYRIDGLSPGLHVFRLRQVDYDGAFAYSPEVEIYVGMPERFVLEPAYPNPFNPTTTLRYAVQKPGPVRIELYNVLGQVLRVLYEETPEPGTMHTVSLDAGSLPSGAYLVRLTGEGFARTQRVILQK